MRGVISIYQYTDKEIEQLLKQLVVVVDSREQKCRHITDYFDQKNIKWCTQKLDYGDYTAKLTIPGKHKDFYLQDVCTIERKRCLNELSSNLSHERLRMEREFMRVRGVLLLLIENAAYEDILLHHYDTGYKPQAFIGTLKSFESKYDIHTHFQKDAAYSGAFIYHTLFYAMRNVLKKGVV